MFVVIFPRFRRGSVVLGEVVYFLFATAIADRL